MKSFTQFQASIILILTLGYSITSFAANDRVVYKNKEYGLAFSYPSTWKRETPMSLNGLIKISSKNGNGSESCNLIAKKSPEIKNRSTSEIIYATAKSSGTLDELKRVGLIDAVVLEKGITKVFNREAYYAISSYTLETMGVKIPVKSFMVITTKKDIVYTFACGTYDLENFDKVYPVFKSIIGTLFIDPTEQ